MCSIYNYIHLHIHKCIHIELPCLFVVVFAQQNKLSKNCRKGSYSNFLNRSLSLLERTPSSASQIGQCLWIGFLPLDVIRIFVLKKKKAQKKDSVFFLRGEKEKKGRAEEKGYLKCKYQKWKLVVFKLSQEKKWPWLFCKKKSLQDSHSVRICGSVWPPSTNTFRLARKWAFWKSAWLLATLKDLGEIKNHVGSFFGPHGFWEIPIFGRQLSTNQQKMQNTQQTTKKKAGHPSFWRFHWEDRSNKLFASNQAKPCGEPLCDACSYPC